MAAIHPQDPARAQDSLSGPHGRSITAALFGVFLVVAGGLFTLANFVELPFQPTLLDLMPGLFGIVAIDRQRAGRSGAALFWLIAGVLLGFTLYTGSFDLARIVRLWPLALILLGISTVAKSLGKSRPKATGRQGELAFLSSLRNVISDPAYTGGACLAVLGGQRLDLRQATLHEDGALIQVFVWWGGVDIAVPEGWSVSTQVFATMGGADDKTRSPHSLPDGMPQLVVRGVVVMGGLEIHN